MAIEIQFSKSDINTPWGFRLAGGAECDVPLTVVKVTEGSIAENVGLELNDVVVRINDYNVEKLTHAETHEVIVDAGQEFTLIIHRGDIVGEVQDDEQNNEEVSNIMEKLVPKDTTGIIKTSKDKNNANAEDVTDEQIAEAISGETEVLTENVLGVNFNKIDLEGSTVLKEINDQTAEAKIALQDKQWSTFLQKPKRPVVKPKKKEPEVPQYPPYRVVIKKQKKKTPEEREKELAAKTTTTLESDRTDEMDNLETIENTQEDNEDENKVEEEEASRKGSQEDEDEINEEILELQIDDDEISISSTEEALAEKEQKITETTTTRSSLSLEEQLAQVQQQLQALAQLPSSIQITLDSVTQQLAKIVKATHKKREGTPGKLAEETATSEDETIEQINEDEIAEYFPNIKTGTGCNSDEEDTKLEEAEFADISERGAEETVDQNIEKEDIEPESPEPPIEQTPTEEEIRAKEIEEQKAAQQERLAEFHQRRLEQRPTHPLAPLQRPIVLPGGRRWSQPDDALPAVKKPQMTDEKICETINTYSEVITGKLKGINFLKYQPPPRNLDYLQKSEVFKLVHDMDPPSRGIAARPEKIASEQDYYPEPHQGSQETAVGV